jgi:hypothetical protein
MDRSRRLTDGTRCGTFMRLLQLDDLMTSYTNARPVADLLVMDIDLERSESQLGRSPAWPSFHDVSAAPT